MTYSGLYFDGKSAAAHRVEIAFEPDGLLIMEESRQLASWAYAALERVASATKSEIRLAARGAGSARLVLSDPQTIEALKARAPKLFRASRALRRTARLAVIGGAISAAVVATIYYGLPPLAEQLVPYVPPSVERRLGDNYYTVIGRTWPFCNDTKEAQKADEILKTMAARLTAHEPVPFEVTIDVVDMGMENAFALPGGHVLVTRQLVDRMESPDELAGVLAHELGHVIERHPTLSMIQQLGLSAVTSVLIGGGSNSGEWLVGAGATLTTFAYSRRLEACADTHALALLHQARISPVGFATFFDRIEAEGDTASNTDQPGAKSAETRKRKFRLDLPTFLSTHPPSPERAAIARAAVDGASSAGTAPAPDAAQWAAVKAACAKPEPAPEAKPPNRAPPSGAQEP